MRIGNSVDIVVLNDTPTGNPPASRILFYVKPDGILYTKDSSGTERAMRSPNEVTSDNVGLKLSVTSTPPASPQQGDLWVDPNATSQAGAVSQERLFVSNVQPAQTTSQYVWIQTGLGPNGNDFTFWIEDGT